jgi:hypothetical protein
MGLRVMNLTEGFSEVLKKFGAIWLCFKQRSY